MELLKRRSEMSESLLREKLRSRGIKVAELSKQLDKMVSRGLLQRRANNYSLGKRR
jgi:DNA-binding MarR family transcriptional regulator